MVFKYKWFAAWFCLASLLLLNACSLSRPPSVADTTTLTAIEPAQISPSPEAFSPKLTETPTLESSPTVVQELGVETVYPEPYPSTVQENEIGSDYPAPGQSSFPVQPTIQSSSPQDAYPAPGTTENNQQNSISTAYPAPGSQVQQPSASINTPYPEPGSQIQQPTASDYNSYPGPEGNTPAATQSETPAPNRSSLTPTPQATFTAAPSVTSVATQAPTSTPTPTSTAIEIDPNFHPTDPLTVQLASGKVQLVEFFAYWCGECRAMAPMIHSLEAQYQDRMNFIYLDTDNPATSELKRKLGYRDQPDNPQFFLLDRSGKILKKWAGAVSAEEFENAFNAALMK